MNQPAEIYVIKIVPENVVKPITGFAMCVKHFSVVCHLANIMSPLLPTDTIMKTFLQDTGACGFCFDAKIVGENENSNTPNSAIKCLMKAVFIPMDASDMATE